MYCCCTCKKQASATPLQSSWPTLSQLVHARRPPLGSCLYLEYQKRSPSPITCELNLCLLGGLPRTTAAIAWASWGIHARSHTPGSQGIPTYFQARHTIVGYDLLTRWFSSQFHELPRWVTQNCKASLMHVKEALAATCLTHRTTLTFLQTLHSLHCTVIARRELFGEILHV